MTVTEVESVKLPLLTGMCGLSFTAIQQGADNTGIIHCHLCGHSQLGVFPEALCDHGCCCLSNSFADVIVNGEVFSDNGVEVSELLDDI